MSALRPYYMDQHVTLFHGNAMDILPYLARAVAPFDAVITDPPYAATHLAWDIWPSGWPALAALVTSNLWCAGSMKMFLERMGEFDDWTYGQDIVWEKHNGSNMAADRFKRVHELAIQFYRGDWNKLFKAPQYTNDAVARQVRRKKRPPQWGDIGGSVFEAEDGGPRMMRSVIYARSCHGFAVNETQKPEELIAPIVRYSVPVGGCVLDPFAGSGTTLVVAAREGRRAVGIELRKEQCDHIVARLAQKSLALEVAP